MKRIGYQDRWVPSMCGLVGDHSFGLVGRALWADARPGRTRIRNVGKGRLVIGPVISAGFASVWCSMAGPKMSRSETIAKRGGHQLAWSERPGRSRCNLDWTWPDVLIVSEAIHHSGGALHTDGWVVPIDRISDS